MIIMSPLFNGHKNILNPENTKCVTRKLGFCFFKHLKA